MKPEDYKKNRFSNISHGGEDSNSSGGISAKIFNACDSATGTLGSTQYGGSPPPRILGLQMGLL